MLSAAGQRARSARAVSAAALAVALGTLTWLVAPAAERTEPVIVVVVVAVLVACACWSVRTSWPATAAVAVTVVVAVYLVLGAPYGPIQLVVSLCCFTVGARCGARHAGAVGSVVAVVLSAALVTRLAGYSVLGIATLLVAWSAVFVALPLLLGVLIRVRHDASARQRTELLARGAEEERLRLAREVHDIAGHALSVVSMQAGVAVTVFDEQPEQARQCLEAVRESADAALRDLHGMLGALRSAAPTAADVPHLVDRVRAAGLRVDLRRDVRPGAGLIDEAVSATVYRVVQESLTNVLRHADATAAHVEITQHENATDVVVRDHGRGLLDRGTPPGHGLSGLRARVESLDGTFTVTDHPAGGVEVGARLPRRVQP